MLAQTISRLAELRPGQLEPLEWLVDLYGRASDSFRLPDALAQLAAAYETSGNDAKAIATYEKLLERTPEDETTRRKYMRLRAKTGLEPISGEIAPAVKIAPTEEPAVAEVPVSAEPALEEETQRYVTQALTDVDLFSSYGLTQKAIDLLEAVLERAPRHAPVLERLLDCPSGPAMTAAPRNSLPFSRKLPPNAMTGPAPNGLRNCAAASNAPPDAALRKSPQNPPKQRTLLPRNLQFLLSRLNLTNPLSKRHKRLYPAVSMGIPMPVESVVHEVDLSDEWAALSEQLETAMKEEETPSAAQQAAPRQEDVQVHAPVLVPADVSPMQAQSAANAPDFDLPVQPVAPHGVTESDTLAADTLFADLAGDLDTFTSSMGITEEPAQPAMQNSAAPVVAPVAPAVRPKSGNGASPSVPAVPLDGPLGDLFEEFRSELGETKEDEDLETHYNLGIAYREMGLLEEAISEFQKVASSADKGPAFRYAMQCSTLLGLAFMEKGQPAIAAIWYERALKTPGLDQESILALRYDLGVAQELAGDTHAAFSSFSQVYAMNIDYRDVSERIALLGKAR